MTHKTGNKIAFFRLAACIRIFSIFLVLFAHCAYAKAVNLDESSRQLGASADYFREGAKPLDLDDAIALYRSGKFRRGSAYIFDFGIGSPPAWVHLAVENRGTASSIKYLVAGMTWLDHVDVYLVQDGKLLAAMHTGDEKTRPEGLTPALGYALPIEFPRGASDIYMRIESIDPMVLPIHLASARQIEASRIGYGYYYGFFYGYLVALCIYNLLLFAGLGERSYLYYSLALLMAISCNFSYTGHGISWVWPGVPWFQRYVILSLMVAYSLTGLLFANRFLSLKEHAPRLALAIRWFSGISLAAMTASILTGSQFAAALLAFSITGLFTIAMFLLGFFAVRNRISSGRYFLAATIFSMLGVSITDLAVWGKIPFNWFSFHAFDMGLVVEATLLALALAYRVRRYQEANLLAERMARQDPLTGLYNRRAFMELAEISWSAASRGNRSLVLIMMDIDHFKDINDKFGHKTGDAVLVAVSECLRLNSRSSDIVARWGGEEFILLLTETDAEHAKSYAEKLRQTIAELRIPAGGQHICLTASFGVSLRNTDTKLDDMINLADDLLYRAKSEGRNRVCA